MKTAWTEKCFNSTLVQLKGDLLPPVVAHYESFNSTLVQLKGLRRYAILSGEICFNSTLVQLKVAVANICGVRNKVSILP